MQPPSPQLVFQHLNGHWGAITLATAIQYSLFTRIESGTATCAALAEAASISPRGTQALLDGLVGLGFLTVSEGRYANTAEASFYLVEDRPAYMGAWSSRLLGPHGDLVQWVQLPDSVKRGGRCGGSGVPSSRAARST